MSAREINKMVPSHDATGFLYSSREVRTMRKRVRGGNTTDFILSDKEREAIKNRPGEDRDDDDLLGLAVYKKEVGEKRKVVDVIKGEKVKVMEAEDSGSESEEGSDSENDSGSESGSESSSSDAVSPSTATVTTTPAPPLTTSRRASKPVPAGYSCKACNAAGAAGAHWIVDCPERINKKTGEKVGEKTVVERPLGKGKKGASVVNPSERKLFISGLPFEVKKNEVVEIFADYGPIKSMQLVTFKDSARCNGQGYLEFEDEADAKKAMRVVDGSVFKGRTLKVVKVERRDLVKKKRKEEGGGEVKKNSKERFEERLEVKRAKKDSKDSKDTKEKGKK